MTQFHSSQVSHDPWLESLSVVSCQLSVVSFGISAPRIRVIRLIRGSQSSPVLNFVCLELRLP